MAGLPISFDPVDTFQLVLKISIFELLSLVGIVVALVSLILSLRANNDLAETRAAEFSFRVWKRFRSDDVQSAFLEIEWGKFEYPVQSAANNGFATADQERRVDRLLSLLDDIAALAMRGVLRKDDVERWSYIFVRVFDGEAMQRYMHFLDDFYRRNEVTVGPHQLAWRWYGQIRRKAG